MHPYLSQAIAAERIRDARERAASVREARHAQHDLHDQHVHHARRRLLRKA
ncbi:MAG: hypothetical protein JO345_22775 [Streptosporangiaceae bacterium]|nr:hypothetical protein [Streptosporangiaceae bacterium]